MGIELLDRCVTKDGLTDVGREIWQSMVNDMGATVAEVLMRENAEMALSSAIGEQVAKIAGAVWIHNLHSTGEEKMAIQTPEDAPLLHL